ncbi:hypothetical protein mflW37_3020 [Mesoplasma florum W37]|uniref:ATPase AAA-type core domain-containing protein n=1 Tax=Mesoplasma florum TaxID=2151 RepID=A0AAD0MNZ1_MESFO|nr:AAA family ATPase [Mesoplasma florum]AGY41369.1 hypothetical protein mflW37_3020 [Mesoplasma florum W37]AVN59592.1 hypothetical protein CG008_01580 [Mesoplasma florum]AVN65709.1 hypothetical protein MflW12_3040 [Mesoplasma florum]
MKYRINKIEFENYKNFKNKQTLNFTTNNKWQNTYEADSVKWNSTKTTSYNPIISILGANASGKSNVIEIFYRYITFLNAAFLVKNTFNNESPIHFNSQNLFNDCKKELKINVFIDSDDIDFCHEILAKYDFQSKKVFITEKIKVIRCKGNKNYEDKIVWNFNEKLKKSEILNNYFMVKMAAMQINNDFSIDLKQDKKNIIILNKIFNTLYFLTRTVLITNRTNLDYVKGLQGINEKINWLIKSGYKLNKLNSIINKTLQTVDKELASATLKEISTEKDQQIIKAYVLDKITVNESILEFPPQAILSNGTINFLDHILILLFLTYTQKEQHKYLIMDELGSSWHTALTKSFIDLFKFEIFDNTTLLFSSHQPDASDEIRKDGVYVITKTHELKNVASFNEVRSEIKFSKNYSSEVTDCFDSYPDFSSISEFIKEII